MNWDLLLEKALAWKKLKPWETLNANQIFAAELGGKLCYLQVLSSDDAYCLAIFPGEEGRTTLLRFREALQAEDRLEIMATVHGLYALQCHFCAKDILSTEEVKIVQAYTKKNGISLRGKNAWPSFPRFDPYLFPRPVSEPEDAQLLCDGLDLCMAVVQHIAKSGYQVPSLTIDVTALPCFRREGEGCAVEEIPLEKLPPVSYPVGKTENEISKTKIKKMKKKGKWACELISLARPASAENFDHQVFPWYLLTMDLDAGKEVDVQAVRDYEHRTNVMLDKLMEAIIRENSCPSSIIVSDDRTQELLRDWAAEMGIRLKREEKPEEIEDQERINSYLAPDGGDMEEAEEDMTDLLALLRIVPDEFLAANPGMLTEGKRACEELVNTPSLSADLRAELLELLNRIEKIEEKKKGRKTGAAGKRGRKGKSKTPEKSYVISVSLGSGCYRHIQISNHALLTDLSDAILDVFGFVDDHAHAFFMDNRAYSPAACYYMKGVDPFYPTTDSVTLEEAGLEAGLKFKYLFDFGEDWTFQCRVLKELEEVTEHPKVIREKGDAPEQYPDWDYYDDDWDDEDDDDWDDDE